MTRPPLKNFNSHDGHSRPCSARRCACCLGCQPLEQDGGPLDAHAFNTDTTRPASTTSTRRSFGVRTGRGLGSVITTLSPPPPQAARVTGSRPSLSAATRWRTPCAWASLLGHGNSSQLIGVAAWALAGWRQQGGTACVEFGACCALKRKKHDRVLNHEVSYQSLEPVECGRAFAYFTFIYVSKR